MGQINIQLINLFVIAEIISAILATVLFLFLLIFAIYIFRIIRKIDREAKAAQKTVWDTLKKAEETAGLGSETVRETKDISQKIGRVVLSLILVKLSDSLNKRRR